VEYRRFEQEFLRLAFTTSVELTPSALAFFSRIPIAEAEQHMQQLVAQGVLDQRVDDAGRQRYAMPDRPTEPVTDSTGLIRRDDRLLYYGDEPPPYPDAPYVAPPRAIALRRTTDPELSPPQAVAAMFLNAMVCPGVGSLVGGRTHTGVAQLSLFLVGLPLIVVAIGLPMVVAAWTWGIATGAQMIADAR